MKDCGPEIISGPCFVKAHSPALYNIFEKRGCIFPLTVV